MVSREEDREVNLTHALHKLGNAADELRDARLYLHRAGGIKFRKRKGIPGHFWERQTFTIQNFSAGLSAQSSI